MLNRVSCKCFRCDHGDRVLSPKSAYLSETLGGDVESARAVNVTSLPHRKVGCELCWGSGPEPWRPLIRDAAPADGPGSPVGR